MKIRLGVLLGILLCVSVAWGEYPFKEKCDLNRWDVFDVAILSASPIVVDQKKVLDLCLVLVKKSYKFNIGLGIYNISFDSWLIEQPATLVVYDASKTCIGDLLVCKEISGRYQTQRDWTSPRVDPYVRKIFHIEGLQICRSKHPVVKNPFYDWLPPGKYYLQAIFHSIFFAPAPYETLDEDTVKIIIANYNKDKNPSPNEMSDIEICRQRFDQYWEEWDTIPKRDDLFRSNAVKIEVIKSK